MSGALGELYQSPNLGHYQDFGNKMYEDSPYLYLQVEPVIKVNFGPGAYAALAYHYTNMYDTKDTGWITQVHWINLRVVYTF